MHVLVQMYFKHYEFDFRTEFLVKPAHDNCYASRKRRWQQSQLIHMVQLMMKTGLTPENHNFYRWKSLLEDAKWNEMRFDWKLSWHWSISLFFWFYMYELAKTINSGIDFEVIKFEIKTVWQKSRENLTLISS